jgi:ABC-type transporter Mla subunit MlaD
VRRRVSDFAAGLIAIGLTVVATYLAFAGGLPWHNDYTLYAHVRSANEMHSRTQVRIAGVEVGRVAGFRRAPAGTAIV